MPRNRRPKELEGFAGELSSKTNYVSADDKHPVFCFRYSHDEFTVVNKRLSNKDKAQMLERLHRLSQLTWQQIKQQDRHKYGSEKIPFDKLKPERPREMPGDSQEASAFSDVTVFRRNSNKNVFAGVRVSNTFHILYVEPRFGDLYSHD